MADIRKFVTKTSLIGDVKPKRSNLMQKIHADSVTIKYMSRDGLVALIQKQRQQQKTRSALNEALLQNIKQAQSMAKSLSEKTSSLPELRGPKPRKSTAPLLASSQSLARALSPDMGSLTPHGFQYRSNGDFRECEKSSFDKKVQKFEQAQNLNLQSLKEDLLKATMIHCRDSKGDYTLRPVLNDIMKKESRVSKSASDLSQNLDMMRFIAKGCQPRHDFHCRTASDMVLERDSFVRDRPLIGRRYYIKENDRFISTMMQQVYLLERQTNEQWGSSHPLETDSDFEIPLRGGSEFVRSEPNFRSTKNVFPWSSSTTRARSSFNIRHSAQSNIADSRKSLLEECMHDLALKTSKTEVEINEYIKGIQDFTTRRALTKETGRDHPFGILQTGRRAVSDNLRGIPDGVAALEQDADQGPV